MTKKDKKRILAYWIIQKYRLYDYVSDNLQIDKRILYATMNRGKTFVGKAIEIFKITKKFVETMDKRNANLLMEDFWTEMSQEEAKKYFY